MREKPKAMLAAELYPEQQEAVESAIAGKDICISGGAGTGKSYIVREIINRLKADGKNVMVCAPTATAASIVQGATIHRSLGIPIGPAVTATGRTIVRCPKTLSCTDTVIIDEISMCRIDLFDSLVRSVEKAEKKQSKHIQLILVGDFYQLPPVVSANERKVLNAVYGRIVGAAYAFEADGWQRRKIKLINLNKSVRATEPEYAEALSFIRLGNRQGIDYINKNSAKERFADGVTLFGRNMDVDKYNADALARLDGPTETIYAIGSNNDVADQTLKIKIGARVVITSNYSSTFATYLRPDRTYGKEVPFCNGSMGTVCDIHRDKSAPSEDAVIVRIDNGPYMYIGRKVIPIYDYVLTGKRIEKRQLGQTAQIPVRLAYAMTIHRVQGMTLRILKKINVSTQALIR